MPIEIRELHIKAVINQGGQTAGANAGQGNSSADVPDREDIVAECVEKVLAILRDKIER